MKENLIQYARYNQWANEKLVTLLNIQAPELIEKEIASSFSTIKKTILHVAEAEAIWLSRLNNTSFPELLSIGGKSIDYIREADKMLADFILSKEEAYFTQSTAYKNKKGEPFTNINHSIIMHVFNHGTFHRGQVVSMLRNGGFKGLIDSTDFITFERL